MARKQKTQEAANEYELDASKLSMKKEKYVDQLRQYLEEQISSSSVAKSGSSLSIAVPKEFTKQMVKLRISKFLYQSGLKNDYRIVSLVKGKTEGYQIVEK